MNAADSNQRNSTTLLLNSVAVQARTNMGIA